MLPDWPMPLDGPVLLDRPMLLDGHMLLFAVRLAAARDPIDAPQGCLQMAGFVLAPPKYLWPWHLAWLRSRISLLLACPVLQPAIAVVLGFIGAKLLADFFGEL